MGFLFLWYLALSYKCLILIYKLNSYDLGLSKMVKMKVFAQTCSDYKNILLVAKLSLIYLPANFTFLLIYLQLERGFWYDR